MFESGIESSESFEPSEQVVHIALDRFLGTPVKPAQVQHLDRLADTEAISFETCVWVEQTVYGMSVLKNFRTGKPVKNPQECGYRLIEHNYQGLVLRGLGHLAVWCLGALMEDNTLAFQNGSQISLLPTSWVNSSDQIVPVFQVCRLPDKRWFYVKTWTTIGKVPFEDKYQLRLLMEREIQTLEAQGKVREPDPHRPESPLPQPYTPPLKSPFNEEPSFLASA